MKSFSLAIIACSLISISSFADGTSRGFQFLSESKEIKDGRVINIIEKEYHQHRQGMRSRYETAYEGGMQKCNITIDNHIEGVIRNDRDYQTTLLVEHNDTNMRCTRRDEEGNQDCKPESEVQAQLAITADSEETLDNRRIYEQYSVTQKHVNINITLNSGAAENSMTVYSRDRIPTLPADHRIKRFAISEDGEMLLRDSQPGAFNTYWQLVYDRIAENNYAARDESGLSPIDYPYSTNRELREDYSKIVSVTSINEWSTPNEPDYRDGEHLHNTGVFFDQLFGGLDRAFDRQSIKVLIMDNQDNETLSLSNNHRYSIVVAFTNELSGKSCQFDVDSLDF